AAGFLGIGDIDGHFDKATEAGEGYRLVQLDGFQAVLAEGHGDAGKFLVEGRRDEADTEQGAQFLGEAGHVVGDHGDAAEFGCGHGISRAGVEVENNGGFDRQRHPRVPKTSRARAVSMYSQARMIRPSSNSNRYW